MVKELSAPVINRPINWPALITAIGSDYQVQRALESAGVVVARTTIQALRVGRIREPRYSVGRALLAIEESHWTAPA